MPSINSRTSSTPVWLAASISTKSSDFPVIISKQESHLLQGFAPFPSQFNALAKILAMVVFPLPRDPENKYACEVDPEFIELVNVCTTCSCPIISSNPCGRYFRYKTILFSITYILHYFLNTKNL